MEVQLTPGICTRINNPSISTVDVLKRRPVVQILRAVQVRRNSAVPDLEDYWNIVISDGEHWIQGFLGKELSCMAENATITRFVVIAIQRAYRNLERSLFIVQELEVIEYLDHRIGTPQVLRIGNNVSLTPSVPATPSSPASQPLPPRTPQISPPSSTMKTWRIADLNQYTNNWQIKARVIQKTPLLSWSNGTRSGVRFNVVFKDASKEIRAVSFEASVHQQLEENKIYLISDARIDLAKWGNAKYEMQLSRQTKIKECPDSVDVPAVVNVYTPLQDLNTAETNAACGNSTFSAFCSPLIGLEDVIAVLIDLGPIEAKTTRYGENVMRSLVLVDETMNQTTLTLWGPKAKEFDCETGAVISVRRAIVSRYQGVLSLSANSDTTTEIDPSIPDAQRLRRWYRSLQDTGDFEVLSQLSISAREPPTLLIQDVIRLEVDEGSRKSFTIRAIATRIMSDRLMYPGCPSCRKKVIVDDGKWVCSNSECKENISEPRYYYTICLRVQDPTGDLYIDGFDEFGLQIFGKKSANELYQMKQKDRGAFDNLVNETLNQMPMCHFTCEATSRIYNDRSRTSYSVKKMLAVNYLDEVRKQISLIQ